MAGVNDNVTIPESVRIFGELETRIAEIGRGKDINITQKREIAKELVNISDWAAGVSSLADEMRKRLNDDMTEAAPGN